MSEYINSSTNSHSPSINVNIHDANNIKYVDKIVEKEVIKVSNKGIWFKALFLALVLIVIFNLVIGKFNKSVSCSSESDSFVRSNQINPQVKDKMLKYSNLSNKAMKEYCEMTTEINDQQIKLQCLEDDINNNQSQIDKAEQNINELKSKQASLNEERNKQSKKNNDLSTQIDQKLFYLMKNTDK